MFDYARGYDPDRAACGVMDIFRLPKFSYYFYRSQRDAGARGEGLAHGPMVFIASHWTPASALRVVVFSNCDEVELTLNGRSLGRLAPAKAWMTQYLPHAPFVFDLPAFVPGALEATGYIARQAVAVHRVATPGAPARLSVSVDTAGIAAEAGEPDLLIAHAAIVDDADTLCLADVSPVTFAVEGGAHLVGPATVEAEAGIASIVLRLAPDCLAFRLRALRGAPDGTLIGESAWLRPAADTLREPEAAAPVAAGVFR